MGVIAFAISGALIAISCGLDLFGVLFIGVVTAVGGGITRDVLIGATPPKAFSNVFDLTVAVCTSLIVFIISYVNRKSFYKMSQKIEHINNVFDAIGLAVFSISGVQVAIDHGFGGNFILAVIMGMITGVGGGIYRDVLVLKPPYVLNKHVYAIASLTGCVVFYLIYKFLNLPVIATFSGIVVIITIRMLATKFQWELPKIKVEKNKQEK